MNPANPAPLPNGSRDSEERRRALFREVNERIRDFALGSDWILTDELEILCECGGTECFEHVAVTLELFDETRNGGGFVVVPGHERSDRERIVTELPTGLVVRRRQLSPPLAAVGS